MPRKGFEVMSGRREAFIVAPVRTPVGRFNGKLSGTPASDLGAIAIRESLKRAGISPAEIDEVIIGNVLQGGQGQGPGRQASIKAGIPVEVPAYAVNMMCASGLKAVAMAAQAVALGDADLVVAGGMESMSMAPYLLQKARTGYRMGHGELLDSMILDGLWCVFSGYHMGVTAENLAEKYGISRQEQDEFALKSQIKAEQAIKAGRFEEEIVPVEIPQKGAPPTIVDQDEHPRFGTTLEALSKLPPAFKKDGTVTAGNSSGINDGASAMVVASEERVRSLGLRPMARIISYASAGVEPSIMGIGPVEAIRRALRKASLKLDDIGLVELNEAFAAQSLAVLREIPIDPDILNVNGGAIALGHPIGASGARILTTLLYEMKRRSVKYGLASLCVGGGMGMAMVVEAVS